MKWEFLDTHEGITVVQETGDEGEVLFRGATPVEIALREEVRRLRYAISTVREVRADKHVIDSFLDGFMRVVDSTNEKEPPEGGPS